MLKIGPPTCRTAVIGDEFQWNSAQPFFVDRTINWKIPHFLFATTFYRDGKSIGAETKISTIESVAVYLGCLLSLAIGVTSIAMRDGNELNDASVFIFVGLVALFVFMFGTRRSIWELHHHRVSKFLAALECTELNDWHQKQNTARK